MKDCNNCFWEDCIPKAPACDSCVVGCYDGKRTSDPSNWKAKAKRMVICNECQYREDSAVRDRIWCRKIGRYMKEDGFCSLGERRNNE